MVDKALEFLDLLRLVNGHPAGFRAAPSPEWALSDLRRHLGTVRREWTIRPASRSWPSPRGRGRPGWPRRRGDYWPRLTAAGRRGVRSGRR